MELTKKDKINQSIGTLLCMDKYKFLPIGLIGEICRDFIKEMEMEI
jgi:hypothetical protein